MRLHEGSIMKKNIGAVVITLALAYGAKGTTVDDWPNGMRVLTNVAGMVLTLEFADATVVAGERLGTRMVVSNASKSTHQLDWGTGVPGRDTRIGQFVVEDDEGNPMQRTVWRRPIGEWIGGSEGARVEPGDAVEFLGDIVKAYSLTNPGIYRVKAVASVGKRDGVEEMIIETPTVLLTVLARPATMPPPQALHTPSEIENILKDRTPPLVMTVTHPKLERPPSVPRVAPRKVMAAPLPQRVQDQSVSGAAPAKKETPVLPSRGVLLALIALLLSGGLVIYLVWCRRKHGQP
jgi:hypothetical protein